MSTKDLYLKFLLPPTSPLKYKTACFSPDSTVLQALQRLTDLCHFVDFVECGYGLYINKGSGKGKGESKGTWLDNNRQLSEYPLREQSFVEVRKTPGFRVVVLSPSMTARPIKEGNVVKFSEETNVWAPHYLRLYGARLAHNAPEVFTFDVIVNVDAEKSKKYAFFIQTTKKSIFRCRNNAEMEEWVRITRTTLKAARPDIKLPASTLEEPETSKPHSPATLTHRLTVSTLRERRGSAPVEKLKDDQPTPLQRAEEEIKLLKEKLERESKNAALYEEKCTRLKEKVHTLQAQLQGNEDPKNGAPSELNRENSTLDFNTKNTTEEVSSRLPNSSRILRRGASQIMNTDKLDPRVESQLKLLKTELEQKERKYNEERKKKKEYRHKYRRLMGTLSKEDQREVDKSANNTELQTQISHLQSSLDLEKTLRLAEQSSKKMLEEKFARLTQDFTKEEVYNQDLLGIVRNLQAQLMAFQEMLAVEAEDTRDIDSNARDETQTI